MTKTQFKALDLFFFSFISALAECINIWAFSKFNGIYYVSFAVVLGLISMVRWGAWGIVVPLAAGLASICFDLANGTKETVGWVLANSIGYLPLLINLIWFKFKGKDVVSRQWGMMILYVVTGFLETEAGKSMCYIGSADFGYVMKLFFAYDLINMAIGTIVYFIACKQRDFVCDMDDYLLRMHQGTPESRIREKDEDYLSLEQMAEKDEVSDISLLDGGTLKEEDLKMMEDTYKKAEGKSSKFDREKQAIKDYNAKKKTGGNEDGSSK